MLSSNTRIRQESLKCVVSDSTLQDITCNIITDFTRLEALSADWNRLWKAAADPEIFQSFAWVRSFWRGFGKNLSLCTPVVYRGKRVLGILPLAARDGTVRFLGRPFSDYNDLLCEEGAATIVLSTMLRKALQMCAAGNTRMVLENLSPDSLIARHLETMPSTLRRHVRVVPETQSSFILRGTNSSEVFRSLAQKKSLRRHSKRLQTLGRLTFRHVETREEIQRHLTAFFDQHISRRAMAGDRSRFLEPEARKFCEALVEDLDPSSQLRFGVLQLDERPIAYHLGFQVDAKFIFYLPTFDVEYWNYYPGEVLLAELLQYAQKHDIDKFDFTVGMEPYKARFANCTTKLFAAHVYGSSLGVRCLSDTLTLQIKERVRDWPRVFRTAKNARLTVSTLLARWRTLVTHDGFWRCFRGTIILVFRFAVCAVDKTFVFCAVKDVSRNMEGSASESLVDIKIAEGSLSDLAMLAVQNPHFANAGKLQTYCERFRDGDRAYVSCEHGQPVHVAWMGMRSQISAPELHGGCKIALGTTPAPVIYECWVAPGVRNRRIYRELLGALAAKIADKYKNRELWLCCTGNHLPRSDMDYSAFRLKYRVIYLTILHWLRFNRIVVSRDW